MLHDRYPRAKVSFGSDVESYPDVIFSTPPASLLRLDIYRRRPRPKSRARWLAYIHGAVGERPHAPFGSVLELAGMLASLAHKGYVVASVKYRLSSEAEVSCVAIHDVKNAIKWLRANAKKLLLVDWTENIVDGVAPAGGQLAVLAATTARAIGA